MNIINLDKHQQLCFLHIPKTAGTSLNFYIESLFRQEEVCPAQYMTDIEIASKAFLSKYKYFRGHFSYDIYKYLPEKPIYITMLRDPVERVVSHFEYWKTHSKSWSANHINSDLANKYEDQRKAVAHDLLYFVSGDHPRVKWLANLQTWKIASGSIDVDPASPNLLELAKEHLQEFAFFGITEYFSVSLVQLSHILGFAISDSSKRLNVNARRPAVKNIPAKTLDAIMEHNQLDMELYRFALKAFKDKLVLQN